MPGATDEASREAEWAQNGTGAETGAHVGRLRDVPDQNGDAAVSVSTVSGSGLVPFVDSALHKAKVPPGLHAPCFVRPCPGARLRLHNHACACGLERRQGGGMPGARTVLLLRLMMGSHVAVQQPAQQPVL